jgi:hypothetical protein
VKRNLVCRDRQGLRPIEEYWGAGTDLGEDVAWVAAAVEQQHQHDSDGAT